MMTSRFLLSASILLSGLAAATSANADPCASGGSLTITASADSLTLSPVAATTFNFGEHVILTAAASGFTIATYAWTVEGPTIKDYNEDLGTQASPALAAASAVEHDAACRRRSRRRPRSPSTGCRRPSQFEPNNGPFTRNCFADRDQERRRQLHGQRVIYGRAQRNQYHASGGGFLYVEPPLGGDDESRLRPCRGRAHLLASVRRRRPAELAGVLAVARRVHPPLRSVAAAVRLQESGAVVSRPPACRPDRNSTPMPVCGWSTRPTTIASRPITRSRAAPPTTRTSAARTRSSPTT